TSGTRGHDGCAQSALERCGQYSMRGLHLKARELSWSRGFASSERGREGAFDQRARHAITPQRLEQRGQRLIPPRKDAVLHQEPVVGNEARRRLPGIRILATKGLSQVRKE